MKEKEARQKEIVETCAIDMLNRMLLLKPDDRYALLEEYGEIIYCCDEELEIDWDICLRPAKNKDK